MPKQDTYCCTTPHALCFWAAAFLVLYGGGLLLSSVWPVVQAFDQTLLLTAFGSACVASFVVNRTFHCGITGPLFLVAAVVVGFSEAGYEVVSDSVVWSLVLVGVGMAGFAEWRVTRPGPPSPTEQGAERL